jgi:hypothetical protein
MTVTFVTEHSQILYSIHTVIHTVRFGSLKIITATFVTEHSQLLYSIHTAIHAVRFGSLKIQRYWEY